MAYFKKEENLRILSLLYKDCFKLLQENRLYLILIEGNFDEYVSLDDGESIEEQFEEINPFFGKLKLGAYAEKRNISSYEGDIIWGFTCERVWFIIEKCPFSFREVPLFFFPEAEDDLGKETLNSMREELLQSNLFYFKEGESKAKRMGVYAIPIYSRGKIKWLFYYTYMKYWDCDKGDFVDDVTDTLFRIFCLCDRKRKEVLYAYTLSCSRYNEGRDDGGGMVQTDYWDKLVCSREGIFERRIVKL